MSDSGGDADADGVGADYGELAVVLAVVAALVLSAALLPSAAPGTALDDGPTPPDVDGGDDGREGDARTRTETSTATSSAEDSAPGGSPSGVPLSSPPRRTGIGSTEASASPLPQTPQFVVEGHNGYWRQTAYTTYTGSAWERSPSWRPMAEGVPGDDLTVDARESTYRVTLLVPSATLPTAWQPDRVDVVNASAAVEASTLGGVRTTPPLPAGTTYRARSSAPPRSAERLRATGFEYPDRIERRYTQLPPSTPRRVTAFTADLTAEARTPYDAAVTIRDWLERKPYSLNASHEPGEPVADQFIFEMERGYCQYYATAMAVMLRSRGVPARYVVGYAPGEAVGDDRYLVTSDRAHAWVEVYFPDVGWVQFDPTASGSLPLQDPRPPYDISLNRSAVAGARVAVTVAKNGTAVVGAPVAVNGERVGWTDASGRVTTTLPYAAEVTVTARSPSGSSKFGDGSAAARGGSLPVDAAAPRGVRGPLAAARPPSNPVAGGAAATNESIRTFRSETNVTVRVEGTPVAGGGVTVAASISDVPFRGATVTLDGEQVGKTDGNGTLALSLAGVAPGDHRIRVGRDALAGATTVAVRASGSTPTPTPTPDRPPPPNVSVSAPLSLPLPGGPATVTVSTDGTPVAAAPVALDGERVGETDENGTLAVSLPVAGSAVVAARDPGTSTTARTTVEGLFRNAALALVGLLVALGLVGRSLRRRGVTPRGTVRGLGATLSTLGRRAVTACIWVGAALVAAGRALRRGARRLAGLPGRLATHGLAALAVLDPRRLLRALRRWLAGRGSRTGTGGEPAAGGRRGEGTAAAEGTTGAPPPLRAVWREFVALVAPSRPRTRTPGEVARYALDRGLPADPVRTLVEAYRDAEYGHLAPDDERLARVREAIDAVRDAGSEGP